MKLINILTVIGTVSAISLVTILPKKASAQDFAQYKVSICAQLDAGKSPRQLATEWVQNVEYLISMNQLNPGQRNQAHQFFSILLAQAVTGYSPSHLQALNARGNFNQTSQSIIDNYQRTINNIEAQSAASPGYQAPSTTCNFNVYTPSPNNSTYTNAANSWANWFNNQGGKWMPRITGKTTQQLYGC
jgi:hypothetical protein